MGVVAQIDSQCQSEPHRPEIQWSQQSSVNTKDKQTSPTVPILFINAAFFTYPIQQPTQLQSSETEKSTAWSICLCLFYLAFRFAAWLWRVVELVTLQFQYSNASFAASLTGSFRKSLSSVRVLRYVVTTDAIKCTKIATCNGDEDNLDYHNDKSDWDYTLLYTVTWLLFYSSNGVYYSIVVFLFLCTCYLITPDKCYFMIQVHTTL